MSDTRSSRTVEIQCNSTSGYGSGLLLGDGIVLTARHVLLPPGRGLPAELDILMRTVSMARDGQRVCRGTLLWPTPDLLADQAPDIALIQFPADAPIPRRMFAAGVDSLDEGDDQMGPAIADVYAVGFPRRATILDAQGVPTRQRDTDQLSGKVQLGAGLRSGTAFIDQLRLGSQAREPDKRDEWTGMSGAALFAEPYEGARSAVPHLLGVVTIHDPAGKHEFKAARIEVALEDPAARAVLLKALAREQAPPSQRPEPPGLHRFVWLLDRVAQEEEFVTAYREAVPRPRLGIVARLRKPKPLIFLLPGAADAANAYTEMLTRLSRRTLPERLGWQDGMGNDKSLYWPATAGLSPAAAVGRLRQRLWEDALCQEGDAPAKATEFQKLISRGNLPRLFHSDLTTRALDAGFAGEFAEWSEFWSRVVPEDRIAPVHVLLVAEGHERASEWLRTTACSPGVQAVALPELKACASEPDLVKWLQEELPLRIPTVHRPLLSRIETRLCREFPERFRIGELRTRLMELELGETS